MPRILSKPISTKYPFSGFQLSQCVMRGNYFIKFFHMCEVEGCNTIFFLSQVATEVCGRYVSLITWCRIPSFIRTCQREFSTKARLKMKRFLSPQTPKCFFFASISQLQRWIPCYFRPPIQRKSKINLRIFVRMDTGTTARSIQKTDWVSKTAFARVHRPPLPILIWIVDTTCMK